MLCASLLFLRALRGELFKMTLQKVALIPVARLRFVFGDKV